MCINNESIEEARRTTEKKGPRLHLWTLDVGREKLKNKSPVLPREEICVEKKGKSAFVNNLRTHAVVYTHTRTHKQKRSEENTQTHALAGVAENTKYTRGKN